MLDPVTAAALITGGAALIGGSMNNQANARAQQSANEASLQSTREQIEFQREMSDTAYRRATFDMKQAGINPIMAYAQGGASTPSGASANIGAARSEEVLGKAVNSALSAMEIKKGLEAKDTAMALDRAATKAQNSQAEKASADARNAELQSKILSAQLPAIQQKSKADAKKAAYDEKYADYDAVASRVLQGSGIISNVSDIWKVFKSNKNNNTETIIDSKTGEILHQSKP